MNNNDHWSNDMGLALKDILVEVGNSALVTGVNNTTISCADSPHGMRFFTEFSVLLFLWASRRVKGVFGGGRFVSP